MKLPLVLFLFFFGLNAGYCQKKDILQKSLVKIFVAAQDENFYEPWRRAPQALFTGSGCVLPGHLILTNAHVVSNAIFIQVLKEGDSRKYIAKRLAVAHDCDLALLKVEDESFFDGTLPVVLGDLPYKRDKVAVYGFPIGGDELSITEGVVSRIEIETYSHSLRRLLLVQTDAAINHGNSGGPVFKDGKVVGVAFQGYNADVAQSTSFFVPVPIIKRFLKEVSEGEYQGIPSLGVYTQDLENDSMRAKFGMASGETGVLVTQVIYGSSAWGNLQVDDVLVSIDGYPIANDGTVAFRKEERIHFSYPLNFHFIGDHIKLGVLRDGKRIDLDIELKKDVQLIPLLQYDKQPTYFIFGGLIFTPLNWNYPGMGKDTPVDLRTRYVHAVPSENQKQIILLNHILSAPVNQGYNEDFSNLVVTEVNGHPIVDMRSLIEAFKDPRNGKHLIRIDRPKELGTQVILDAAEAAKSNSDILDQYGILDDRSDDLKGQP